MTAEVIHRLWAMSLQAGILILIVLAVRFCLNRYPRIYSYCLWGLVGIRLLYPVQIESSFSLQPDFFGGNAAVMQAGNNVGAQSALLPQQEQDFDFDFGSDNPDNFDYANASDMESNEPQAAASATGENPMELSDAETSMQENAAADGQSLSNLFDRLAGIFYTGKTHTERAGTFREKLYILLGAAYCIGVAGLSLFYLFQYLFIRKRLSSAVREKGNVWQSDRISSPFVMGVICPRIYLPYHISGRDKKHVLRHEKMHIRHCDPLIRILGTLCLCLHWWNPLVWVGVYFMNQDMEMFCDESVLRHAPLEERKAYARTLLSFAERNAGVGIGLAFIGESHTERRIRHIMKKRKRSLLIICLLVALAFFCIIALLTVPKAEARAEDARANGNAADTALANAENMAGTEGIQANGIMAGEKDARANMVGTDNTPNGTGNAKANSTGGHVVLSADDLSYLKEVCQSIPDFTIEEEMDTAFWKNYLFYTYTSDFGREEAIRYSEQYHSDIRYMKVDYEEADETILQLFGKHLSEYGILPESLTQGDNNIIYENGTFFIAVSDSPRYYFMEDGVTQTDILTEVSFIKMIENDEAVSQVQLYLLPADNARGFVLDGKEEFHIPAGASGTIVEGQAYEVEMNPYGKVTFAVYAPDLSISPYADATYRLLRGGEEIYSFPRRGTGVREDESVFDEMAAVSFPDLNQDGYTDVVAIAYYEHAGGAAFSQARIFTYNAGGYFLEESYLEAAFNESHETKTAREVETFAAQPENQDYFVRTSIYGNWRITGYRTPGVYALAQEEIESYVGARLEYGKDFLWKSTDNKRLAVTQLEKSIVSVEELETAFLISKDNLGLTVTELTFYHLDTDGSLFGNFFYLTDSEHAFIYYNGVFFEAVRE